ncbi:glycosyltransferase family 4 protein [Labilibacter marinus]|uniref:glycosyltransferase family 4 protein n=1 Tax=Labilibacter marinus TaxID=1477105 RepID=UPI00094F8B47|nr:glycosyltransferase family 4 protein [Labilibacter marinus]
MKVLLIGPMPNPITGVSLANKVVVDYLSTFHENVRIDFINTNFNIVEEKEKIGRLSLKKGLFYFRLYKYVGRIRKYDKIYITTGQTFFGVLKYFIFFLIAKFYSKELIVHIHGNHVWKEYTELLGLKRKIFFKTLSMADKGIVLSESLRKNLSPFIPNDKIFVLNNFVEDYLISESIRKENNKLNIVFLSNLMREKGILDLLETLILLKSEGVAFKAKIAGGIDESMQDVLEDYFIKLKGYVEYQNVIVGNEKKSLLNWGNVFVLPTKFDEGQPISILEAMSTGNIILTTKKGGIIDIFEEGVNGFYIKENSPKSILSALLKINHNIKNYEYISVHNFKEAKKKYRVQNFIDNLHNIFRE